MNRGEIYLFTKEEYRKLQRIIESEIKLYFVLKVQLENKKESEAQGIDRLFPSMGVDYEKNQLKVKQMERALEILDTIERQIIEMKYHHPDKLIDTYIYMELGIRKEEFYKKKKSAILSIAYSIGII